MLTFYITDRQKTSTHTLKADRPQRAFQGHWRMGWHLESQFGHLCQYIYQTIVQLTTHQVLEQKCSPQTRRHRYVDKHTHTHTHLVKSNYNIITKLQYPSPNYKPNTPTVIAWYKKMYLWKSCLSKVWTLTDPTMMTNISPPAPSLSVSNTNSSTLCKKSQKVIRNQHCGAVELNLSLFFTTFHFHTFANHDRAQLGRQSHTEILETTHLSLSSFVNWAILFSERERERERERNLNTLL